ncbi:50S ribosomal protein L6 [Halodesulfovibrio marinisediminis]|uniref:Large ribosomal subunit protein uL6 n=1 Tax=Halodesulfovibrio marinisediminis DSM 17456 TaxID=1121457 RepID=A0A1N6DLV8_9BACT|nr:50S ribosomal protein L6 [Halodesulfovibrio marinisediminis]SIN71730.1 LSU ribosomal protein L6P [Halodesulfovibrio marinisediminis DSM 17456]
MSRIGKQPVAIPSGVEVKIAGEAINVKGPKGSISTPVEATLNYEIADGNVVITRKDESRVARAQHGLRRTLIANCIEGVSKGFSKTLEVNGVGYKVAVKGNNVELAVGFSHPVSMPLPEGLEAKAEGNKLTISGIDKQLVGEFAATVRRVRPPEPYKGKGIKYDNEQIRRKAGKSAGK